MGGYSAIDYDLARYVLIDHFNSDFISYGNKSDRQLDKLIAEIALEQPDYSDITTDQFILSMAYAYILEMGWSEEEFYNFTKNESGNDIVGGVDISISRTYRSSTHGAMSPVMTVCEKYVWQVRNVISGFLCDRLLFGYDAVEITDYGMLDNFVVPSHDLCQINPDNIPEDRPWHIPEPDIAILNGKNECRDDVVTNVMEAPIVNWRKWLFADNLNSKYEINSESLITLNMYSCFYGTAGVMTSLFISTILVDSKDVIAFVEEIIKEGQQSDQIADPFNWHGGVNTSCYITPKEICCFPWKTRYEGVNVEKFSQFKIFSAVDKCCYNSLEYGDVYYYLPSEPIRQLMGIIDTDGNTYTDIKHKIVAQETIAGEKWRTYQSCLFADKNILCKKLQEEKQKIVWVMQEQRSNSGITAEKYGEFGINRIKSFVGYFDSNKLIIKEIRSENMSNLPL